MNPISLLSIPTIRTPDLFPNLNTIPSFNVDTNVADLSNSHMLPIYISSEKAPNKIKAAKKRRLLQMVVGRTMNGSDANSMASPTKKRRKKNNQCNRLLFTDFSLRSQHANSIDPSDVRACKQNIKRLCPLHDMLPIISGMELQPFKYHSTERFGGMQCTLRAGHLQYECRINTLRMDADERSAYNNKNLSSIQLSNVSPNKYFRNHFLTWVCTQTGPKYECKFFKEENFPSSTHMEIPLNVENILIPFMKLLKNGASNCNLYYSVKFVQNTNGIENGHKLQVNCFPLDVLAVEEQIHTKRLTFKVLSCGTFRRNLQPMPDACRITRVSDISCALVMIDNGEYNTRNSAIGLKIYSNTKNSNRIKAHGDDIIIGAGFDCASRCSWHKPRLYWVADTYKYRMDPLTGEQNKQHYENFDLRISLLWPRHISGLMNFYAHGFAPKVSSESINLDSIPMPMHTFLRNNNYSRQFSPTKSKTSNSPMNFHPMLPSYHNIDHMCYSTSTSSTISSSFVNGLHSFITFEDIPKFKISLPPPFKEYNCIEKKYNENEVKTQIQTRYKTKSASTNNSVFFDPMINLVARCGPLKISNLVDSSVLLSLIEQDLFTDCRQYISVVAHLDISSSDILDRCSQLMINCIKYTSIESDVFCDYFITFVGLMAKKLGVKNVINGLCRLWIINPTNTSSIVKQENQNSLIVQPQFDLWSFLHLIAYYGRLYLIMFTMQKFPLFRARIAYKFANNVSSLKKNSPLVIAIQNKHLLMIEYVFEQICKADECLASNVIRRILQSRFSENKTILEALANQGLYSIITYLLALNQNANYAIFSSWDISHLQNLLRDQRRFCSQSMMNTNISALPSKINFNPYVQRSSVLGCPYIDTNINKHPQL